LTLLRRPLPVSKRAWMTGLGAQVLTQCARRLAPPTFRLSSREAADLLNEAVCMYARIGANAYLYGDAAQILYCLFAAINLGERLGPTSDLAIASADLGNIFGLMRLHRVARTYHRLAIRTADRLNNPVISANVLARTGLYQLGIGNWGACRDFEAAMA